MNKRTMAKWCGAGMIAGAVFFVPATSFAQGGGFDPSEFLKRMDANGNGMLEPDEVSGRAAGFVRSAAERAGLDPNQPLSIDKIAEAMKKAAEERRSGDENRDKDRDRGKDQDRRDGKTPPAPPLVPGFGEELDLTPPPGFTVPLSSSGSRYQRPLEERFEKAVIDRVDDMLRQYDRNKNQSIDYETDEGREVRWQYPASRSDKNNDGRLDREELCYRIADILGSRERRDEDKNRSGGSSGDGRGGDDSDKVRRYAEGLLRQYDSNRNGQLEKDEWSKMRGDYEKADANHDGVITLDELTERLKNYSRDEGSSSSNRSRSDSGGRSGYWNREGDSKNAEGGMRFLTPLERLPKGLPTWFTRNDANQDGQISMAEYSTTYNETTAAEFMRLDHNGDGIITAEECLAGEKESQTASSGSASSASPSAGATSSASSAPPARPEAESRDYRGRWPSGSSGSYGSRGRR